MGPRGSVVLRTQINNTHHVKIKDQAELFARERGSGTPA
jgi:hypothetical protein